MNISSHLPTLSSLLTPKKVNVKGDLILEIVRLQEKQVGKFMIKDGERSETPEKKMEQRLAFILLAPFSEEHLLRIKSDCTDKLRNNYSISAYVKYLRSGIDKKD